MKWINIKDRKPPEKGKYYVKRPGDRTYSSKEASYFNGEKFPGSSITLWLDESEPSFTIEDMNNAYKDGMICGFERCGQGNSNTSFVKFMKEQYNIDITQ